MSVTNNLNIPTPVLAWFMDDDYDTYGKNAYSATKLIAPIRQTVLTNQLMRGDINLLGEKILPMPVDASSRLASRIGQTIHGALENLWRSGKAIEILSKNFPEEAEIYRHLKINPDDESDTKNSLFMEQRRFLEIQPGLFVTGKYDLVDRGRLKDYKTGGTYLYRKDKTEDYTLQGSLYRLLAPHIIIDDYATFYELYINWSSKRANAMPDTYPPAPSIEKTVKLMSIEETRDWANNRITLINAYDKLPQVELPLCTDKDLWIGPPEFKYFSKLENKRATKAFGTDRAAADAFLKEKGGKGHVVTVQGKAARCNHCPVFHVCSQKDMLIDNDQLA